MGGLTKVERRALKPRGEAHPGAHREATAALRDIIANGPRRENIDGEGGGGGTEAVPKHFSCVTHSASNLHAVFTRITMMTKIPIVTSRS